MAQVETKTPGEESFIHTRTCSPPKTTYHSMQRDPCNFEENFKKPEVDNLWPRLQERAAQDSFKPPCSNIALGDERVSPFTTSYSTDFYAPFNAHERLRSPMRNKDLAATQTSLKEHYASSYNRVGEKRLAKMISTMRERLSAKLGNNNDNAFKMRKLFKMYDKKEVGMIHFEDFRMFSESFGMQLDDDSLLAMYHVYDPTGSGYLAYEDIVKQLLDGDYYAMYSPAGVDNTQALVDAQATEKLVANLRKRIKGSVADMRSVFASFDTAATGVLPHKTFEAGCAALGVVLSAKEHAWVQQAAMTADGSGMVHWGVFCDAFRE
uniref:EF-hand domain-containing protein n=1 Tax=Tetradesmus obliquus TaxID=3088 RepID=A0A383VS12_TETOB|eukprot:jgi/Sobl393_1/19903/SZX68308.1